MPVIIGSDANLNLEGKAVPHGCNRRVAVPLYCRHRRKQKDIIDYLMTVCPRSGGKGAGAVHAQLVDVQVHGAAGGDESGCVWMAFFTEGCGLRWGF